ncbi:hypothetical protein C8Q79DRAFT_1005583 [Trametes meyenii]|nr:hypothetical protein C8Q79DRAFT_1005583 [Trametes meyenii]
MGSHPEDLVNAAFALITIGQFALVVLLALLHFSSSMVERSPVLLNLLVITLSGTIPHFFLMYAGEIYNPNPSTALCVTQAALLEGVQCAFAIASLCLVIDFLADSKVIFAQKAQPKYLRSALLIVPYITFAALATGVGAFGAGHPTQVRHMGDDLACTLQSRSYITGVQLVISAVIVAALLLQTYAAVHFLAARRHPSSWRCTSDLSFSQAARIGSFICLQALLLILSTLHANAPSDSLRVTNVVLHALMPLTTAFLFGLTQDCCNACKRVVRHPFGRQKRPVTPPPRRAMCIHITIEHIHDEGGPPKPGSASLKPYAASSYSGSEESFETAKTSPL